MLLLLFLVFFTMDMVIVKPVVMAAALLWMRKELGAGDFKNTPLFYLAMPVLALVQFLLFNRDPSLAHLVSFTVGVCYWLMAFFAFIIIRSRVNVSGVEKVSRTAEVFFWLNCVVSLSQLALVMAQSGTLNPYASADLRYGNSTGDYIKGVFRAPCYINTFVSSAFAFYFLGKKKYNAALIAVVIACLTTSNFATLALVGLLVVSLFLFPGRRARWAIIGQLVFVGAFYLMVSFDNFSYLLSSIKKQNARELVLPELGKIDWESSLPGLKLKSNKGKFMAFELTFHNMSRSTDRLLLGSGMGNFSSQLALNTSDLQQGSRSRLFARLPTYVAADFRANNYQVYKAVYALPPEYHSVRHLPRSFYGQLLGEYGWLGVATFSLLYCGYFLKRVKMLRVSLLTGLLLGYFLFFDYLFEYLSVVLFFELFFLLEVKQKTQATTIHTHAA